MVKSRLALGSPGCSFVRLSPCQKWPNTKENGYWLPPSDHIQSETLFQTRQDQEKGMNGPASLLHSWRGVLFILKLLLILTLQRSNTNAPSSNIFCTTSEYWVGTRKERWKRKCNHWQSRILCATSPVGYFVSWYFLPCTLQRTQSCWIFRHLCIREKFTQSHFPCYAIVHLFFKESLSVSWLD